MAGQRKYERYIVNIPKISMQCYSSKCEPILPKLDILSVGSISVLYDSYQDNQLLLTGIWIKLGAIKCILNKRQYELVMAVMSGNLSETRSVVDEKDTSFVLKTEQTEVPTTIPDLAFYGVILSGVSLTLKDGKNESVSENFDFNVELMLDTTNISVRQILVGINRRKAMEVDFITTALTLRNNSKSLKEMEPWHGFTNVLAIRDLEYRKGDLPPQAISAKGSFGGRVDIKNLEIVDTRAPTTIQVSLKDLRFIVLESLLIRLGAFIQLPRTVIKDGWIIVDGNQMNYVGSFQRRRCYVSLDGLGNDDNVRYMVTIRMSENSIPVQTMDLRIVLPITEGSRDIIFMGGDDAILCTFQLGSKRERDDWMDAIHTCMHASGQRSFEEIQSRPDQGSGMELSANIGKVSVILPRECWKSKTDGILLSFSARLTKMDQVEQKSKTRIPTPPNSISSANIENITLAQVALFSNEGSAKMPPFVFADSKHTIESKGASADILGLGIESFIVSEFKIAISLNNCGTTCKATNIQSIASLKRGGFDPDIVSRVSTHVEASNLSVDVNNKQIDLAYDVLANLQRVFSQSVETGGGTKTTLKVADQTLAATENKEEDRKHRKHRNTGICWMFFFISILCN